MHLIFTFFTFFMFSSISNAIDTKADKAIVVDFTTNEVLFEKNADEFMPPASMTKIMTIYASFDRLNKTELSINDTCIISSKAYKMGGSRTFLEIDDRVTINELLKGVIVQSGNDASVALSECLAGTEEDFVNLMNFYAKKIGMNNSNFVNASGWPNENHYSTVRDIAILSNTLIRDFKDLYKYFNLKEFTYNNIKQPNRNKLLSQLDGSDGLKTGYTKKSGWGISGSAIRDKRRITVVINGTNSSRSRLNESSNLLNWAFNQTSKIKILEKNQFIKEVDVWLGNKPTINLISKNDVISILSFDQKQLINSKISYNKPLNAPIKKGEKIASMNIAIQGKKDLKIDLISDREVKKINPFFKISAALKYLIFGNSLNEI